jgi:hypothetical protein
MSSHIARPVDRIDARLVIQEAFEGLGGLPRLIEWANRPENLSQFYCQIWNKIIPKDIKSELVGENGGPMKLKISWISSIEEGEVSVADKNTI